MYRIQKFVLNETWSFENGLMSCGPDLAWPSCVLDFKLTCLSKTEISAPFMQKNGFLDFSGRPSAFG